MDKVKRKFPLVADDDMIISQPKIMTLYDNEDLINNIQGVYQDKDYRDVVPVVSTENMKPPRKQNATKEAGKSYAERMREESKLDIKKKRQTFLTNQVKPSQSLSKTAPKKAVEKPVQLTEMSRFSKKLSQDSYILAELSNHYQHPKEQKKTRITKNSFDFLKKSQIYNQSENQLKKEQKIAQELNLTRFDELD